MVEAKRTSWRKEVMRAQRKEYPDRIRMSAIEAQGSAYMPYSGFRVGAVVFARHRNPQHWPEYIVARGCNVENAAYGSTICAERGALLHALAVGADPDGIIACYVVGPGKDPITPCGACRQMLAEFSPVDDPIMVFCGNKDGEGAWVPLTKLLPRQFPDPGNAAALKRTSKR